MPEHEAQLQPLLGLTPSEVQQAWQSAAEKARERKITAQMVKNAVKELKSEKPEVPVAPKPRARMAAHRQLIDETIGPESLINAIMA